MRNSVEIIMQICNANTTGAAKRQEVAKIIEYERMAERTRILKIQEATE